MIRFLNNGNGDSGPISQAEYDAMLADVQEITGGTHPPTLEYITGVAEIYGNMYIDTGLILNESSVVEMTLKDDVIKKFEYYFGIRSWFEFCRYGTEATKFFIRYKGTSNDIDEIDQPIDLTNVTTIRMGKGKVEQDGVVKHTYTPKAFTTDKSLYLFYANGRDNIANFSLYRCKVYTNDTLVGDFVPAMDGNIACLYDYVTGRYFKSYNGASFIAGPANASLSSVISYIKSEKNTKIIPENIKQGVDIFDVTGTYAGDTPSPQANSIKIADEILTGKP